MSGKHLNEDMLQQYVLEPAACPPEAIAHLAVCPQCRIEAAAYLQLGKALRDQPAPEFAFDLAAAVMEQLGARPGAAMEMARRGSQPGAAVRVREPRQGPRLTVPAVIAIVAALPAWLFRKTAYLVFSDMSGAAAWVILALAGVAVLFSCYKYYRRYQQVLQLINK